MTDYIFAAGFGYNLISKYKASDLLKDVNSDNYGGTVVALASDSEYIYAAGYITQKIYKYRKSDLVKVAESADYGGAIEVLAIDDDYIYAAGQTTQKVYKYNKRTLAKVAETADYGGIIRALLVDDDYVYAGGWTGNTKLFKYDKSDMSKLAESAAYESGGEGIIRAIDDDATYLYIGGGAYATQKVYKLAKSDLSEVDDSAVYTGLVRAILVDGDDIYVGGYDDQKIYKLAKADLSQVAVSAATGGVVETLADDDDSIYSGGIEYPKVIKFAKSDLSKTTESQTYTGGGAIYAILLDEASEGLDVISTIKPIRLKRTREINGTWNINMTCEANDSISADGYLEIDSETYLIKKYEQIKEGSVLYNVDAFHNFVELGNPGSTIDRFYRTDTVENLLTTILAGSYWSAGDCDIDSTLVFWLDKRVSRLEALNLLAEKAGGELYWHSDTRTVDLLREIGTNTGLHIRVDKNATFIKREVDSRDLITRLYVIGPDNKEMNSITVDECEDDTAWVGSGGLTITASTDNKMQGNQAINIIATALNETATLDLTAGGAVDLSGCDLLKFRVYSATANASGFTFGIGEAAYTEITVNTGALEAGCWHEIELDLSGVADADKNAIRYLGFKNLTDGAATIIADNIRAFSGDVYLESVNVGNYKYPKEAVYQHSLKAEKTAHEVIIYPSDDSYVYEDSVNTNYGSSAIMKIREYGTVDLISYIKFAIDSIPTGATITSATLNLNVDSTGFTSGGTVDVELAAADWNQDTLTYSNRPAAGAKQTDFEANSTGAKEIDILTTVQNWHSGATDNYGLKLDLNISDVNKTVTISSKESDNKPYLKVQFTTETDPTSIMVAAAQEYLDKHDEPKISYSVKLADLSKVMVGTWESETISLGDTLRVYDVDLDLNTGVRVVKITENLLDPADIYIELANKAYTSVDLDVQRAKQLSYAMPFKDNPRIINADSIQVGYLGSGVNQ